MREVRLNCNASQYKMPHQYSLTFENLDFNWREMISSVVEEEGTVTLGSCVSTPGRHTMVINSRTWDVLSEPERYQLVAHEMIHCLFDERHSDDSNNIMYPVMSTGINSFMVDFQVQEYLKRKCK
jgi:hypothetical protein